MIEQDGEKSLSAWRLDLKRFGRKHWLVYYKTFLASPVSSIPRFYKALNLYGEWAMFEAIIAASSTQIIGDPLNYVIKISANKWKEAQQDEEEEAEYLEEIEAAKKVSQQKNDELAKKLKGKNGRKKI
jgi:hypothetical protein